MVIVYGRAVLEFDASKMAIEIGKKGAMPLCAFFALHWIGKR